jgi:uncharacterized protein (DUF433 family)
MEKSTTYGVLGHYIVTDPEVCHGKPTFRGTRIMVVQVLQMVAEGMDWETIIEQCHSSITKEAIAEAISLASKTFVEHAHEYEHVPEPIPA